MGRCVPLMRGAAFMNEEHILKSTMSLRLYDWGVAPNPVVSGKRSLL